MALLHFAFVVALVATVAYAEDAPDVSLPGVVSQRVSSAFY